MARDSTSRALREIRCSTARADRGGVRCGADPAIPRQGHRRRGGVRGAGRPARADGAGGLPEDARRGRVGGRRGRVPGRLPRAGARAGAIRRREGLKAWLYGVAVRTAKESRRRAARRRAREGRAMDVSRDRSATIEGRGDDLALLDEELNRLPERLRVPLVLCELGGPRARTPRGSSACPRGPSPAGSAAAGPSSATDWPAGASRSGRGVWPRSCPSRPARRCPARSPRRPCVSPSPTWRGAPRPGRSRRPSPPSRTG